jgi:hypothetical protein
MARTLLQAACLLALSVSATLFADEVRLKDGRVWIGKLISKGPEEVVISTVGGEIRVPTAEVAEVRLKPTPKELYQERAKVLKLTDVHGHYLLGRWAESEGLVAEAKFQYALILAQEPDHDGAHCGLGHIKEGGRWLTYAEFLKLKGYARTEDGRWVPPTKPQPKPVPPSIDPIERDRIRTELRELAAEIRRSDGRRRLAAMERLSSVDDKAAEQAVLELLGSSDPYVRAAAAGAAARLGLERGTGAALEILLSASPGEAATAALEAYKVLRRSVSDEMLFRALQARDPRLRERAAWVLGEIRDEAAVPHLIEALYLDPAADPNRRGPEIGLAEVITPEANRRYGMSIAAMSRLLTSRPADDDSRVRLEVSVARASDAVRAALVRITKVDHGYSKWRWWRWWSKAKNDTSRWEGFE